MDWNPQRFMQYVMQKPYALDLIKLNIMSLFEWLGTYVFIETELGNIVHKKTVTPHDCIHPSTHTRAIYEYYMDIESVK